MNRFLFFTLLLIVTVIGVKAQTITEWQELTGAYGSGKYAPYWHIANRQGLGSEKTDMAYARVGVGGNHPFKKSGITLDWGADFVAGMNMAATVFVQQAYVDCSWRKLRLSVGQKERWDELMNHRLTTGALVESGNARPIPQVRLDLYEYWTHCIRTFHRWQVARAFCRTRQVAYLGCSIPLKGRNDEVWK